MTGHEMQMGTMMQVIIDLSIYHDCWSYYEADAYRYLRSFWRTMEALNRWIFIFMLTFSSRR